MRLYVYHGDLIIWFAYSSLCMEPATLTNFFLDLATSKCAPTIIQYYREAGTSLIQHICAILAFESGRYMSYGTPNTPLVQT